MDNDCFLVDWLSFRSETHDFFSMSEYLGLTKCSWASGNGFYGYRFRKWCNGISIHYGNDSVDGVLVEMSGTGCRSFETFSDGSDWVTIFFDILHDDDFVVTRLDIAFDDKSGLIPIKKLYRDIGLENYVSKFKSTSIVREDHPGHVGQTIYLGSCQSEIRYRIYDKAYERGFSDMHWIRFECQLRRSMAANFIRDLVQSDFNVGQLFASVLTNYFRVVHPPKQSDQNKRRWPVARYWKKLVEDALPVSLWERKDLEYNKHACENYVYKQAGNSAYALIQIDGLEKFYEKLCKEKPPKTPERIRNMVSTELQLADRALEAGDNILSVIGCD